MRRKWLQSDDYRKLKKDPMTSLEKKIKDNLRAIKRTGRFSTPLENAWHLNSWSLPQIHGLHKIHKYNIPFEAYTIRSPTYQLAQELSHILSPLLCKTESYIKISTYFVNIITNLIINEDNRMVSFDVKSLFTMVSIDDSLTIFRERLLADK